SRGHHRRVGVGGRLQYNATSEPNAPCLCGAPFFGVAPWRSLGTSDGLLGDSRFSPCAAAGVEGFFDLGAAEDAEDEAALGGLGFGGLHAVAGELHEAGLGADEGSALLGLQALVLAVGTQRPRLHVVRELDLEDLAEARAERDVLDGDHGLDAAVEV